MLQLQRHACLWKLIAGTCLFLGVLFVITMTTKPALISQMYFDLKSSALTDFPPDLPRDSTHNFSRDLPLCQTWPTRTEFVNNSGAAGILKLYKDQYLSTTPEVTQLPDPNNSSTITTWWQALAMIDWYMKAPVRYNCQARKDMGNWPICQDEPYTIKPPCLVYSFGINWQYEFDDAMAKLGCEVHMFDPSMKVKDHKRSDNAIFHNMGIGSYNTDAFVPRNDVYIKDNNKWKVRTVKAIMKELGHENRVIDVFKMDVESYEWAIMDNMMETDVFKRIRQFDIEYHLFKDFPLPEEYVHNYQIYTRVREIGFREYHCYQYKGINERGKFTYQADVAYVNAFFDNKNLGR